MMTGMNNRMLLVGIQSFTEIRKQGYLYVDKTDLIWNLANQGNKYNYLSRPRRFGKSVLVDTLQAYFEGKKELFEGLKIMNLEKEWVKRPVIRLDMSQAGSTAAELRLYLDRTFKEYEQKYDIPVTKYEDLFGIRLHEIIESAYEKTGLQVAILIDDYDFPLLNSWGTSEYEPCINIYGNMFCVLKSDDYYEKFSLVTSTTKLTKFSSGLNNLSYISSRPQNAALCGFTEQEITDTFLPEIDILGRNNNWTIEEAIGQLKANYGGYHFCTEKEAEVFNPSSLIKALANKEISNNIETSDILTLLPKVTENFKNYKCERFALLDITMDTSDVTEGGITLLLYNFGYLTIKEYMERVYLLCIPNREATKAFEELPFAITKKL